MTRSPFGKRQLGSVFFQRSSDQTYPSDRCAKEEFVRCAGVNRQSAYALEQTLLGSGGANLSNVDPSQAQVIGVMKIGRRKLQGFELLAQFVVAQMAAACGRLHRVALN
jgi:hypothetical protein